jgi:DNA-binding transcriptional ArsR family regulator
MPAILSKLRPFVFPLRYSRYDDSDPLEHEAREEVYEIVNESPGSYLSEVSEEADLPLSTTRHHIRVLEREDLVSGAKLRGKRRFYPAYADGVELAAALSDEATAAIIDAIARLGAASVSDLADDIGRDPSTISHHLQRLESLQGLEQRLAVADLHPGLFMDQLPRPVHHRHGEVASVCIDPSVVHGHSRVGRAPTHPTSSSTLSVDAAPPGGPLPKRSLSYSHSTRFNGIILVRKPVRFVLA